MRKLAAILGILGGAFLACSVQAAYVNDRLLFEEKFDSKEALAGWKAAGRVSLLEKQGPDGGNAVRFQAKNGNATISRPMDPGTIRGMIAFEAQGPCSRRQAVFRPEIHVVQYQRKTGVASGADDSGRDL